MKQLVIIPLLLIGIVAPSWAQNGRSPFSGRWDITVTTPNATYPGWMELVEKDGQPVARYQPRGGKRAGWHPLTVKLRSAKGTVRARRGYWVAEGRDLK